jgi:hypothetical protein
MAINDTLGGRKSFANMLRVLKRDEDTAAAKQCRNWIIWLGTYPIERSNNL